jgi:sugar phosphate isomerase/epimerase
MDLLMYRALWGAGDDYRAIAHQARDAGFDGLEGGLPEAPAARAALRSALRDTGLRFIGEICSGGPGPAWWIPPRSASVTDHLRTFEEGLQALRADKFELDFVNCMGGLDAWPIASSVEFFARAMEIAAAYDVIVSFETHRSRSTFSPWATLAIVRALPDIRLTCDFSHWCVVAERLIDDETEVLSAVYPRAYHVQCRVGYAQGPQVPDPAAPAYRDALAAHQRWWAEIWSAQRVQGRTTTTMTPEFGSDGYQQVDPATRQPYSDLWQINRWMADTERAHFQRWLHDSSAPS